MKYLKPSSDGESSGESTNLLLPNPNEKCGESGKAMFSTANEHVAAALSVSNKRKRSYRHYEYVPASCTSELQPPK